MIALCSMVNGEVRVRLIGEPVVKDVPTKATTCTKSGLSMRLVRSDDQQGSKSWKSYRNQQWR